MIHLSPALRAELSRRIRAEEAANALLRCCPSCKQDVPLSEWGVRRGHHTGLQDVCKVCFSSRRSPR